MNNIEKIKAVISEIEALNKIHLTIINQKLHEIESVLLQVEIEKKEDEAKMLKKMISGCCNFGEINVSLQKGERVLPNKM